MMLQKKKTLNKPLHNNRLKRKNFETQIQGNKMPNAYIETYWQKSTR